MRASRFASVAPMLMYLIAQAELSIAVPALTPPLSSSIPIRRIKKQTAMLGSQIRANDKPSTRCRRLEGSIALLEGILTLRGRSTHLAIAPPRHFNKKIWSCCNQM